MNLQLFVFTHGDEVKSRGLSVVVRDSSSIKSMPANTGTFDRNNPDIRYSVRSYSAEESAAHEDAALAHFGRTYSWKETGYLTRSGKKLDFSGKHEGGPGGYRTVDHRDIRDALGEDYGGDDYSGAMVQFMAEGNIRISPESYGINLSVLPTKAQEMALDDYISRVRGEVILDI